MIALERELREARYVTSELERKIVAHIETRIQELDDKINRVQVLDLTWAIWGLLISFVGTAWGFGAPSSEPRPDRHGPSV